MSSHQIPNLMAMRRPLVSVSYSATLLDTNHVPHAYPEGQNKDQPYADALLHQRSIEVHHLVLLIDDCRWHLDLGPFCNEIGQHLGLVGHPRDIQNALTHQLECPLCDSSCGVPVLDDFIEREGCHDRHRMRLEVVTQLSPDDQDIVQELLDLG